MYHIILYDKFNTDKIKEFSNESEIIADSIFDGWLRDDACDGELLAKYKNELVVNEIRIKKSAGTTKKVTVTMTDKTKKRALNLAVLEIGSKNISGYITYLINKAHQERIG